MPLPPELFEHFDAMQIVQHPIEWNRELTGRNLKKLRETNDNLARYTCKYSRLYKIHNRLIVDPDIPCPNDTPYVCSNCDKFHKREDGTNDVSTRILSKEKGLSTWRSDQISAMEGGRDLTFEKVLFYAFLAQVPVSQILVLDGDYMFNSEGIIVKKDFEL